MCRICPDKAEHPKYIIFYDLCKVVMEWKAK